MKEKLSALIDGEFQSSDLQAHLGLLRTDAELRRAWDAYHLIGDALRGHVSADFTDRVLTRLHEEPTVLAPRRETTAVKRTAWYAMSAAAGIAAVTMVVLTASSGWRAEPRLAAGPAGGISGSVTTVAADPRPAVTGAEVENYLLAHQPYSHTSAMQGIAPYARTVAHGRGIVRK